MRKATRHITQGGEVARSHVGIRSSLTSSLTSPPALCRTRAGRTATRCRARRLAAPTVDTGTDTEMVTTSPPLIGRSHRLVSRRTAAVVALALALSAAFALTPAGAPLIPKT